VLVRTIIRGFGKTLICVGILLFLFVGYQLWGTGIAEQRGQKELEKSFNRRLTPLPTLPGADPVASTPSTVPIADLGGGVAIIEIPKIDVKKFVVEGVEVEDLKNGPGHYPGTAMPGEKGNAAIAGHRTTYGAPFYNLNELAPGDPIFVTTPAGRFRYDVMEDPKPVTPDSVYVLDPTEDDRLTLTTCHPRFSAAERLIVVARLVSPPAATTTPPPPPPDPNQPSASVPARSLDAGLSGGTASKAPAIKWGALAAAIWIGGWLLGRAWRRWPAYAVATVPFLVVLFVFYENVARLLPANV
jgi:sortase A